MFHLIRRGILAISLWRLEVNEGCNDLQSLHCGVEIFVFMFYPNVLQKSKRNVNTNFEICIEMLAKSNDFIDEKSYAYVSQK